MKALLLKSGAFTGHTLRGMACILILSGCLGACESEKATSPEEPTVLSGTGLSQVVSKSEEINDGTESVLNSVDGLPDADQKPIVVKTCLVCHGAEVVFSQRLSEAEWGEVILRMREFGAVATEEEFLEIHRYMVTYFGPSDSDINE